jgi:hypothetical protein
MCNRRDFSLNDWERGFGGCLVWGLGLMIGSEGMGKGGGEVG